MQNGKKLKGWEKETLGIKVNWEIMKKEIDSMKTDLKTLQIEVDRILKKLEMKSSGEEFRQRMAKSEKKDNY